MLHNGAGYTVRNLLNFVQNLLLVVGILIEAYSGGHVDILEPSGEMVDTPWAGTNILLLEFLTRDTTNDFSKTG